MTTKLTEQEWIAGSYEAEGRVQTIARTLLRGTERGRFNPHMLGREEWSFIDKDLAELKALLRRLGVDVG